MHRFFVTPEQAREQTIFLSGREAHHALHVLRVREGEIVGLLDGAGTVLEAEVQGFDRDKIRLQVRERKLAAQPRTQISLLQAIPKAKLFDSIVQKATELGVHRIVPLLTERVVIKLGDRERKAKADKWRAVALEAAKQCGTPWIPKIEEPLTPGEFLSRKEVFELPLLASLGEGARHPKAWFEEIRRSSSGPPGSVCIWVGPEGDFTPDERQAIEAAGARPISLGPLVLRVETAAIYCLAILNYELQLEI